MRYIALYAGLIVLLALLSVPIAGAQPFTHQAGDQPWHHDESSPEQRFSPRIEVVMPLQHWLPAAQTPATPVRPGPAMASEAPAEVDCAVLARRLSQIRSGGEGGGYSVGTRQLREQRDLEADYRHACKSP